jgi:leader peptidase (prepilin peptidase) / N-methyltransferase
MAELSASADGAFSFSPSQLLTLLVVVLILGVAVAIAGTLLVLVFGLAVLCILAATDLVTRRVPNAIVYPSLAVYLMGFTLTNRSHIDEALAGGAICFFAMLIIQLIGRGALGMGDVKYGMLMGCLLGPRLGPEAIIFGFMVGAVAAIILMAAHKVSRRDSLPFTPFLAGGTFMTLIFSGWSFG